MAKVGPEWAVPTSWSSLTREASTSCRSGQVSWLPGLRLASDLPRVIPEWRRIVRLKGGGLAGYSGGTAQVFDLLPFYPPEAGGTLT